MILGEVMRVPYGLERLASCARAAFRTDRGRGVQAAAPYQIANAKLATPRPGATAVSDDLSGRLASAAPKPVDRIVIDRPVKMASAPREITPSSCDSIDATSRITYLLCWKDVTRSARGHAPNVDPAGRDSGNASGRLGC